MKHGRELDALIAEKVMGLEVVRNQKGGWSIGEQDWYDIQGDMQLGNPLPSYSEDISAAWEVVEKLHELGYAFQFNTAHRYREIIIAKEFIGYEANNAIVNENYSTKSESLAHAICLAALEAVKWAAY